MRISDLDGDGGAVQPAETEVNEEYFCYRCNMSKRSRRRVFWHTRAKGTITLCGPCGERIAHLNARRERRWKPPPPNLSMTKVEDPLLTALATAEQAWDEDAITSFVELIATRLSGSLGEHYYEVFSAVSAYLGIDDIRLAVLGETVPERLLDLHRLCGAMAAKHKFLPGDAAHRIVNVARRVMLVVTREEHADRWVAALVAAFVDGAGKDRFLGLDVEHWRQLRAILFFRNCMYSVAVLEAWEKRIVADQDGAALSDDALKTESWATLTALQRCMPQATKEQDVAVPDAVVAAAKRVLGCAIEAKEMWTLSSKQVGRMRDWLNPRPPRAKKTKAPVQRAATKRRRKEQKLKRKI